MGHPGADLVKMLVKNGARETNEPRNGRHFLELSGRRFSVNTDGRIPQDVMTRLLHKAKSAVRAIEKARHKTDSTNKQAATSLHVLETSLTKDDVVDRQNELPGLKFEPVPVVAVVKTIKHRVHGSKRLQALLMIMRTEPTRRWSIQELVENLPSGMRLNGLTSALRACPGVLRKSSEVEVYREGSYNYAYLRGIHAPQPVLTESLGEKTMPLPPLAVFESEAAMPGKVEVVFKSMPDHLKDELHMVITSCDPAKAWMFIGALEEWLRTNS